MREEGRERRAWCGAVAAAVGALALVVAPSGGAAQEASSPPLVTDRPDFTESAVAVGPGRVQLEAGYSFSRDGEVRRHDVGEALVRIGVAPSLELRAGLGSFSVRDRDRSPAVSGFDDVSLGTKVVLTGASDGRGPRTALLVDATLPTGEDGFGADGVQPGATLALGWDLPGGVGLGANLGYTRGDGRGGRFDELSASGTLSLSLSGAAGAYVEYFGLYRDAGPADESFVDVGVTYLLGPDLQLDARLGLGLDGPDPDYFTGVGVSVRR